MFFSKKEMMETMNRIENVYREISRLEGECGFLRGKLSILERPDEIEIEELLEECDGNK